MNVLFTIYGLNQASQSSSAQHLFDEQGGFIGRSNQCEWVLPDKSKKISRKHAHITYSDNSFYIDDVSSNGLFQALHHTQILKGNPHKIENGEGFIIGDFSIKATLMQSPSSYTRPAATNDLESISQADPFSLNPLEAMNQEEDMILNQRLGDLDDFLIIKKESSPAPQADNLSSIYAQVDIASTAHKNENLIPEDWDLEPEHLEADYPLASDDDSILNNDATPLSLEKDTPSNILETHENIDTNNYPNPVNSGLSAVPKKTPKPQAPLPQNEHLENNGDTNLEDFFKILGFSHQPQNPKEREEMIAHVATMFVSLVDGLTYAMQHRAEAKTELRLPVTLTSFNVQNNPFKYCPTPQAALAVLLAPAQRGIMPPKDAIQEAFNDLHKHHLGLLAGTRAAVQSILAKLSPERIDSFLEANANKMLMRNHKRWKMFTRLHQEFKDDKEKFSNLFIHDFARAYEVQGKVLNPSIGLQSKGAL